MSRSGDLHEHYLNSLAAEEILNNFANEDGLSYEEVLAQQASMYQSFQERPGKNNMDTHDPGHRVVGEGSARIVGSSRIPIATPSRPQASSSNSRQHSVDPNQASSTHSRHDLDDPDTMQYEELLELTESVGVENRGISALRISALPTSKYKSGGFFSKSKKKETCVICQMDFNSREQLITLPCLHRYHSKCISHWLTLKKNCPICQKEVV